MSPHDLIFLVGLVVLGLVHVVSRVATSGPRASRPDLDRGARSA